MPRHNESQEDKEQEFHVYYQAARFASDQLAGLVYGQAQALLKATPCDLSAYRFLLDHISHVAILGERPPAELEQAVLALLAAGESAQLSQEVLRTLAQRRAQMQGRNRWVEGHYRPGKRIDGGGR